MKQRSCLVKVLESFTIDPQIILASHHLSYAWLDRNASNREIIVPNIVGTPNGIDMCFRSKYTIANQIKDV
jgi:hypothetical protein